MSLGKARTTTLGVAVTGLLSAGLVALPAHAATPDRAAVAASVPGWARADARTGTVRPDVTLHGSVYLKSQDPAGLAAFATAVSTPGNRLYHHYLTASQMMHRFGPAADAVSSVSSWLRANGLKVTRTSPNQVAFQGSAANVDSAFATTIASYRVGSRNAQAPATPVTVPASLSRDVLAVFGLATDLQGPRPLNITDDSTASGSALPKKMPCSAYYGQKKATKYPQAYGKTQPYAVCGYIPGQLRSAYSVPAADTGQGVTVAITDVGTLPTMAKDLKKWDSLHGVQAIKKGQYKEYIQSGASYNPGWAGEESLDVEAVHGMAPDAKILYFGIQTDFTWAFDQIVDQHLADVVTDSWTTGIGERTAYEQDFQMGATEGIGFNFSAGDSGQAGNAYPSSDPYVTSIGGSSIGIAKDGSQQWQISWESDYSALSSDGQSWTPAPPGTFQSGTGGGTSTVFAQPAYQKGVVPKKYSKANGNTPMRVEPDIAAEADPTTGFLQGYSSQVNGTFVYGEDRIGGTSLSSPLVAGMMADAIQADGGTALGFANPAIYALAGSDSFTDVQPLGAGVEKTSVREAAVGPGGSTVVAIATLGQYKDGGLDSAPGYDTTTGVGTPDATFFTTIGGQ